jgi:hypothetical protein
MDRPGAAAAWRPEPRGATRPRSELGSLHQPPRWPGNRVSAAPVARESGGCAMIAACAPFARSFPSPCSLAFSSSPRARRLRRARSFPTPPSCERSSGPPTPSSRTDRSPGRARARSTSDAAGPGRMRWPRSRTVSSASATSPSGLRGAGRASGRTEAIRAETSASRRRRRCCASGAWQTAAEAQPRERRTPWAGTLSRILSQTRHNSPYLGAPPAPETRLDAGQITPIWQLWVPARVRARSSRRPG